MKHFQAIAVDFNVAKVASDLDLNIPIQDQFRFEFDTFNILNQSGAADPSGLAK
jgi:hypothetical protein